MTDKAIEAIPVETESRGLLTLTGPDMIKEASKLATELKNIIDKQILYTDINGKKHVHVDGWTTLGALIGVYPEVAELVRAEGKPIEGYLVQIDKFDKYAKKNITSEKFVKKAFYNKKTMKIIEDQDGNELRFIEEIKYIAIIELKTRNGIKVGRAMSMCSNFEEGKLFKDEYSIASMAQTRATGKTFRLPFSWIMTLAGYAPTPSEDMENEPAVTMGGNAPEKIAPVVAPVETKAEFIVPKEIPDQVKLWKELVDQAKKLNISIPDFLKTNKAPNPPKTSSIAALLRPLSEAIEAAMEKLEHETVEA